MQQVNLYTEEFRPKKVRLPLQQIILLPFVMAAILAGVTFWLKANYDKTEARIVEKSTQAGKMDQRVATLEAQAKLLTIDESLVAANERLRSQLVARQQIIEVLDSAVVRGSGGFSNLLVALARQRTDGLWLNHINIGASGQSMLLEGITRNADRVPGYLQNLRGEQGFVGRTFTLFNLALDPEQTEQLNFSLQAQVAQSQDTIIVSTDKLNLLEQLSGSNSSETKLPEAKLLETKLLETKLLETKGQP